MLKIKVLGVAIGKERYAREFLVGIDVLGVSASTIDVRSLSRLVGQYVKLEKGVEFAASLCDVDVEVSEGGKVLLKIGRFSSLELTVQNPTTGRMRSKEAAIQSVPKDAGVFKTDGLGS
jgi:hypothetical protein